MRKLPAAILSITASSVLPNRSMIEIEGKTIFQHIIDRLNNTNNIEEIILSTGIMPEDDELANYVQSLGIRVFRGPKDDVLARFLFLFEQLNCSDVLLVRGDTPLIDPHFIDRLVEAHVTDKAEYSYSEHLSGLPYGLGAEIINKSVLDYMQNLDLNNNRCSPVPVLFRLHLKEFKTHKLPFDKPNPDFRFGVETQKDLDFIRELFKISNEDLSVYGLLETLGKHEYLADINRNLNIPSEIGLEKLFFFPEKLNSAISEKNDFSYPVVVELSLTNSCNLKCEWCSDKDLKERHPGSLEFDSYKKLVDDLSQNGTKGLVIEGGGEPTVFPKFHEAVEYAIDRDLSVGLITNGLKFDYEKLVPRMEWVRVSLDSDSQSHFLRAKGKDMFYEVLNNILRMCEIKEDCVIGVGYVVTMDNLEHLEEIVILLKEYGVDYIYFRPVIDRPDLSISTNLNYLKKYESENFSVMIHAMQENKIVGNKNLPCIAHSLSCIVCGDGSVYICGRLDRYDWWEPLGNIHESSFREIWYGRQRVSQIETLNDPKFCSQWCPECRLTKYNILLDQIKQIKTRNFI
jgi:spore coat polysaccharide biosynthesis protein SpsF (cytidylyltransferase family)/MoaA/NifB/PqqE/SkfB family radical SAM enzyme